MPGSQAMACPGLSSVAVQAAACAWAVAVATPEPEVAGWLRAGAEDRAACAEGRVAGAAELAVRVDVPVSVTAATAAPATASTQTAASRARHGWRRSRSRRCHHNLIVVISTRPQ